MWQSSTAQRDAINAYFAAFTTGNFEAVPFAPDVTLTARGSLRGSEQLREQLRGMAAGTRNVIVRNLASGRRHACAEVTLESNSGTTTRFVDCFDFDDVGRISAIRVYVAPGS